MVTALVKEIALTPAGSPGEGPVNTVYFGGGTPSILSMDELERILAALKERFIFSSDAEITLEANPDDISMMKLMEWRSAGINRLSVGLQSFADEELLWMNRAHTAAQSLECIDNIINAGFRNFSVDLIYGSPLLTNEQWKQHVAILVEKNIPHISCYALTVEPNTALDKMIRLQKKTAVDPEKQAEQFLLLMDWMQSAGYQHYEISNFAKPGMRSKHNSNYWSGEHYYGFGPSAHSFDGSSRKWNIANNALYIQSLEGNIIPSESELLTPTQQLNEYIMTSLRTTEGLALDLVEERFGQHFSTALKAAGAKWEAGSKLQIAGSQIILTREGKLFADGIAADLFF